VLRHADDVKGQAASGSNREGESTEARRSGGAARSSVEGPVMGLERRGCVVRPWPLANWKQDEPVDEAKPFTQRSNIGSRVTREGHARFWECPEVKFLRATRQQHQSCAYMGASAFAQKAEIDRSHKLSLQCQKPTLTRPQNGPRRLGAAGAKMRHDRSRSGRFILPAIRLWPT
jgi:hypothetical protein